MRDETEGPGLPALVEGLIRDRAALDARLAATLRALPPDPEGLVLAVRLAHHVCGFKVGDITRALDVMRSSVERYVNNETKPNASSSRSYMDRLIALVETPRTFELDPDPVALIEG